jgi:phosphatidylinositol glycan class P protein
MPTQVRAWLRSQRQTTLALPERGRLEMSAAAGYGFVGYVLSIAMLLAYLLWAWVPDSMLRAMGITYTPSKYWAVAVPCWACVTLVWIAVVYRLLCLTTVPALHDARTVTDAHTRTLDRSKLTAGAVPPLADVPITRVNAMLYGE